MNIDRLLNKKVVKMTVMDLLKALEDADKDAEVILTFNMKYDDGESCVSCYLAEVLTHLKYDGVLKEKLENSEIVELNGFNHLYCEYKERK